MLTTNEALPDLESRLAKAGFDAARPDLALAWRTFREFGAQPVEVHDDSFLFESGQRAPAPAWYERADARADDKAAGSIRA